MGKLIYLGLPAGLIGIVGMQLSGQAREVMALISIALAVGCVIGGLALFVDLMRNRSKGMRKLAYFLIPVVPLAIVGIQQGGQVGILTLVPILLVLTLMGSVGVAAISLDWLETSKKEDDAA